MTARPRGGRSPARRGPRVFRVLVGAADLELSRRFYETLLGVRARRVADDRVYLDGGSVILAVINQPSDLGRSRDPPSEPICFATDDLEAVHRRARRMGCLSSGLLHGDVSSPMGEIVVRPWGERSFYVRDPSGNPLCFVDSRTRFTGTPRQVAALRRAPRK